MHLFKNLVKRDFTILKDDFTKHALFTLFVVALSSIATYLLITSQVNKALELFPKPVNKTTVLLPKPQEAMYTERGSPYDNRTIDNSTSNVFFHGSRNKKQIALTFDAEMTDGMKADVLSGRVKISYDHRIIDTLVATHTKATLFLTGMWIELYPQVTQELAANPLFELGSHSYTDSSYFGFCYGLKQLDSTVRIEEIGATEKLLREHGHIDNQLFRFPGGCYTPSDVKLVNQANDVVVHWDVAGNDGFNENTQQIINNVLNNVQNGSIIVLHMNGTPTAPKTADALPAIISSLKAKGFEFVKINELLNLPAESRS
ncbi:MAG TPA: polysaccharide deacetylase family protein [Patescibacteria group bacterium]|nr:polysaccharide deacetylase family protein [Patescibacteria group bacterium]